MFSVIHQWTARILFECGQRNSELVESVSNSNVKCQALSAWCDAASTGEKISCRSGVPKPSVSKIAKIRNMHLKGYMFYQKASVKWIAEVWYTKYEMWINACNGKQRITVQQESHNRMELWRGKSSKHSCQFFAHYVPSHYGTEVGITSHIECVCLGAVTLKLFRERNPLATGAYWCLISILFSDHPSSYIRKTITRADKESFPWS